MSNEQTQPLTGRVQPEETPQGQQLATRPSREVRVVVDDGPLGYLLDTSRFEHMHRIARAMASASLIPEHLWGDNQAQAEANCFMVVNQALRWGVDPFAIAGKTYAMKGKLGYEGQLIAAVVNSRPGMKSPLDYVFNSKQGDELAVVCFGSREHAKASSDVRKLLKELAESGDRSLLSDLSESGWLAIRLAVKQAKTSNKIWLDNPEQKLTYSAAIMWARRYTPEMILGVIIEDDVQAARDIPGPSFETDTRPLAIEEKAEGAEVKTTKTRKQRAVEAAAAEEKPEPAAVETKTVEAAVEVLPPAKVKEPEPVKEEEPEPEPETMAKLTEAAPAQEIPVDLHFDDGTPTVENLLRLLARDGYTEQELIVMAAGAGMAAKEDKYLSDIKPQKMKIIYANWKDAVENMRILRKGATK